MRAFFDSPGVMRGIVEVVDDTTVRHIVDNLVTSGATVCELSKVLRRAGAKRIYAAAIARTVLSGDPSMMIADEEPVESTASEA